MRVLILLIATAALAQDFVPDLSNPLVPRTRHLITNGSVVSLAKAGFDEGFIVELIQTSRTRLDASTAGLIELKKEGVSEDLIRFVALWERRRDTVPQLKVNAPAAAPMETTHIERHWWGYRWLTFSRGASARPTTNSTLTIGASTAPHAESTTSPR